MQLLASAVVACALLGACANKPMAGPDDVAGCYGGYGLAVQVTHGACPSPGTFNSSQLKLTGEGVEHTYDYSSVVDAVSEPWPSGFTPGDAVNVDVLVYASGSPCHESGTAATTVDLEACTLVDVTTTCICP